MNRVQIWLTVSAELESYEAQSDHSLRGWHSKGNVKRERRGTREVAGESAEREMREKENMSTLFAFLFAGAPYSRLSSPFIALTTQAILIRSNRIKMRLVTSLPIEKRLVYDNKLQC